MDVGTKGARGRRGQGWLVWLVLRTGDTGALIAANREAIYRNYETLPSSTCVHALFSSTMKAFALLFVVLFAVSQGRLSSQTLQVL